VVGGQGHAPAALPPGKTRYPLYRRLGGPQSRSGRVRKISPTPGFDPQTVQPVGTRYTDYAIPDPIMYEIRVKKIVSHNLYSIYYTLNISGIIYRIIIYIYIYIV